jgi:hypothetical protein
LVRECAGRFSDTFNTSPLISPKALHLEGRWLVALLGGNAGDDVLDLLEARYTGEGSYELEKRLRESDIKVEFFSY